MGTKAGIFSGSFNPIHNGHMAIARALIEQETLDVYSLPTEPA